MSKSPEKTAAPIAYSIDQVTELTGLGRTSVYAAIGTGALIAKKFGRRTLVTADDLRKFIDTLPSAHARCIAPAGDTV